jgi:hypothetical protein
MLTTPYCRDERPRRTSPDTYVPRRRSNSRESHRTSHRGRTPTRDQGHTRPLGGHPASFSKTSHKARDGERWERDPVASESRRHRRDETSEQGSKYRKELFPRRHSPPRDHRRHRSPEFRRPRSPTDKRTSFGIRDSDRNDTRPLDSSKGRHHRSPNRPRSPSPRGPKSKFAREDGREYRKGHREHTHGRRSSRSPAGEGGRRHPAGRARDDKERDTSRGRERPSHRDKSRRGHSGSRTPAPTTTPDGKMSWRPPYDHRGPQPARGGWPAHDPRYSHSPPYQGGYHGSPQGYVNCLHAASRSLLMFKVNPATLRSIHPIRHQMATPIQDISINNRAHHSTGHLRTQARLTIMDHQPGPHLIACFLRHEVDTAAPNLHITNVLNSHLLSKQLVRMSATYPGHPKQEREVDMRR